MPHTLLQHGIRMCSLAVVAATLALAGCSTVAPMYQVSNQNAQSLQDGRIGKAQVGPFTTAPTATSTPSIRGRSMTSPYNDSYADYLAAALQSEMANVGLLDPRSSRVITGTLLSNTLDASIGTGLAAVSARFVVRTPGGAVFDKVLSAKHEWESSFMGAIAIPRARESYASAVQNLLAQLFADPDFVTAMRQPLN
jgi:hypothetical protein